jgi:hypothetical protein
MIRYSNDAEVNRTVTALIADMGRNPYDWRGTDESQTIAFILEIVRARFGDYARGVHIPVH